jgi:hypothetical protein
MRAAPGVCSARGCHEEDALEPQLTDGPDRAGLLDDAVSQ